MTKLYQHRDALLDRVVGYLADRPFEHLCLSRIAEACGVSLWALRYNFGNVDRLFRAMASHLIDRVIQRAAPPGQESALVHEAIVRHVRSLADLLDGADYRRLAYFVLRNGRHHPWLEAAYEERLVAKLCADVEETVLAAGERRGETILMRGGAVRAAFKILETGIVLSRLLPPGGEMAAEEREDIIAAAARRAFAATYAFEWTVSSAV